MTNKKLTFIQLMIIVSVRAQTPSSRLASLNARSLELTTFPFTSTAAVFPTASRRKHLTTAFPVFSSFPPSRIVQPIKTGNQRLSAHVQRHRLNSTRSIGFKNERLPFPTTSTIVPTVSSTTPITRLTTHRPIPVHSNQTATSMQNIQQLNVERPLNDTVLSSIVLELNSTVPSLLKNQIEADPELRALREKVEVGFAAQKKLRERLRESTSRLHAPTLNSTLSQTKTGFSGISRQKAAAQLPKIRGVKTAEEEPANQRNQTESVVQSSRIHSGRAGSPSPIIAKRFHSNDESTQVEVQPSDVQSETSHSKQRAFSAGRSAILDDNTETSFRIKKKGESAHEKTPIRMPAFCRRCYKFWKQLVAAKTDRIAIFQYCCAVGSGKGEVFRQLKIGG
ncbi:hypothetical protein M3Y95_00471300 [Aphelenchoides besseyi]|nr:hypothetical protein M3Y95_00471300 [Aphelenchoides besseyi]